MSMIVSLNGDLFNKVLLIKKEDTKAMVDPRKNDILLASQPMYLKSIALPTDHTQVQKIETQCCSVTHSTSIRSHHLVTKHI